MTNDAVSFQVIQKENCCLLRGRGRGVNGQFRVERRFIGIVDAGEVLQLAGASFLVEPFGIALLTGLDRSIEVYLDKRQLPRNMQGPGAFPVLAVGADEARHGEDAAIGKKLGYLTDATDVLFPISCGKTQILIEAMADIVAVEDVCQMAALHEGMLQREGNGALA